MDELPPCSAVWHTLPAFAKTGTCPACGRDADGNVPPESPGPDTP